jgi:hypothetical protein
MNSSGSLLGRWGGWLWLLLTDGAHSTDTCAMMATHRVWEEAASVFWTSAGWRLSAVLPLLSQGTCHYPTPFTLGNVPRTSTLLPLFLMPGRPWLSHSPFSICESPSRPIKPQLPRDSSQRPTLHISLFSMVPSTPLACLPEQQLQPEAPSSQWVWAA